jgi:hypothetical protein
MVAFHHIWFQLTNTETVFQLITYRKSISLNGILVIVIQLFQRFITSSIL